MLAMLTGGYAAQLQQYANGIDARPLVLAKHEAKSYGEQHTFNKDITSEGVLLVHLHRMADDLTAKVREDGKSFRTIALKLRYNDMQDVTRSVSLEEPSDLADDIYSLLKPLLKKAWERRVSVRLVGLKLSQIYGAVFRSSLPFEGDAHKRLMLQRLAPALDSLRREHLIMRGHELWLKPRPPGKRQDDVPDVSVLQIFVPIFKGTPPPVLNFKSYYSFLDSTLSIEAIIEAAKRRELTTIGLVDANLHGAVPFFQAAKEAGIKPVLGAELSTEKGSLLAFVKDRAGYKNLCQLLTIPKLTTTLIKEHREGLLFPKRSMTALPTIRYLLPEDRLKYDILQSIRTLTRLRRTHPDKRTAEMHPPTAEEWSNRFTTVQLESATQLGEACEFSFEEGVLRFPQYQPKDGSSPKELLHRLANEGLKSRYGSQAAKHLPQLEEELGMISEVGYDEYFLVVWDLLQECKELGIDWITRGSAADSLVCYCLGISGVCPIRFDLYFRRFLNRERMAQSKLPDIDIDFPHDRKDDVVDLIFRRYGNDHAAIVGGFNTFQSRSAVADIAKVLGVSEFQIRRFTENVPYTKASNLLNAVSGSLECKDREWNEEPYKTALMMASFLDGFPRYPKMHPCGVVVSKDPIHSLTPTFVSSKGYPTTHFDMESVEDVGLIKLDILAQGGLAVMRDAVASIRSRGHQVDLERLEPWGAPAV